MCALRLVLHSNRYGIGSDFISAVKHSLKHTHLCTQNTNNSNDKKKKKIHVAKTHLRLGAGGIQIGNTQKLTEMCSYNGWIYFDTLPLSWEKKKPFNFCMHRIYRFIANKIRSFYDQKIFFGLFFGIFSIFFHIELKKKLYKKLKKLFWIVFFSFWWVAFILLWCRY